MKSELKEKEANVIINAPEQSMWRLIRENKYPPTRVSRYCCEELLEELEAM